MPYEVSLRFKTDLFITEITRTVKTLDDVNQLQMLDTINDYEVIRIVKRDEVIDAHQFILDVEAERRTHKRVATGGK